MAQIEIVTIVRDYKILPPSWARPFGLALPWLELALGILLILGVVIQVVAAASVLMLASFAVAVGMNLLRGRKNLSCGCSGTRNSKAISGWTVVRDIILIVLALVLTSWGQDDVFGTSLVRQASSIVFSQIILPGNGLPFTLAIFGLLMVILLVRQLQRFIHTEGRL
jgi:hypothetical protein